MTDKLTIHDLKPDKRNPRKHSTRNLEMIRRSLSEVGAARSIVISSDNEVLAGNGVIEAAAQAGIERVRVVEADGNEIIAVRRTGLTEEQKRKIVYYDNRTAELAEWDWAMVREDSESGLDLSHVFDAPQLEALFSLPTFPEVRPDDCVEEGKEENGEWIECPACGHKWKKETT